MNIFIKSIKKLLFFSLFLYVNPALAQDLQNISGIVRAEGETVIGATITEKGTGNGTVTDLDGRYAITIHKNATLQISYLGYKTKEIKTGNQTEINVSLETDNLLLDEVIVVGYGVQQKKLITGAGVHVSGEQIAERNTVNTFTALQGLTPGVNITKQNGKPGEGFKVIVRGIGTIGDSSPLYVIDGVTGGDINTLNPADIESVDVLKDAASAAIYGSRAANGVILITTKQGIAGKTSISYDGYYGWQSIRQNVKPLGAKDYLELMQESGLLTDESITSEMIPQLSLINSGEWNGTNWLNELIDNNAPLQNHALNINKGSDSSAFSFGFSYTTQEPNIAVIEPQAGSSYDRYTLRLNSEHTLIKLPNRDLLKFGENISIHYSLRKGLGVALGNIYWNDIRSAFGASPLFPAQDENGNFGFPVLLDPFEVNPMADMYYNRSMQNSKNYASLGNLYFVLEPVKNLKLKSSFGLNYSGWSSRSYVPAYDLNGGKTYRDENAVSQQGGAGLKWQIENVLTYDFILNKDHQITALLGSTVERSGLGENFAGYNQHVEFDDFFHAYLTNAKEIEKGRTSLSGTAWGEGGLLSYFSRINYNYRNKYMATLILRADGSSVFARGHRWGYFPSVSAGWNISEEAFMEPVKPVVDYLKLRASWGENGNNRIPEFRYASTIDIGSMTNGGWYYFGDTKDYTIGSFPAFLPNEDLKWETSRQLDIGFDMALFAGHLGINFDLYNKKTVDWLVQPNALGIWGTAAPFINGGDIVNKGVEWMLNWNDRVGDFKYTVSGNIGFNRNEVVRIANEDQYIAGAWGVLGNGLDPFYRAEVGKPIGYFLGYKTAGIFQNQDEIDNYTSPLTGEKIMPEARPGDVIFLDLDNSGEITMDDRTEIGNPHPDFNYGISLGFEYKGFDFSVNGYGVAGNQIVKSYRENALPSWRNYTTDMLGRWHGEGTSNRLPALNGSSINWQYISDLYIENGDYFRITYLSLGYDFKKILKRLPLQQVKVYIAAQNLFTFTKYTGLDPEVSAYSGMDSWAFGIDVGNYPSARTYMIGVRLKY
jgi:TonB-linked SusC/RagA family outer membrane protein